MRTVSVRFHVVGLALMVFVLVSLVVATAQAQAVGGEGESWPSFNESDGCGSPWSLGPNAETKGALPSSTILRGPEASYLGRTIGQVFASLVWWDVPGSNDESLRVHVRALPALDQVESGLQAAAADGRTYSIVDTMTFGYTARTVGGRYRVSQHGFGNAIDINSSLNPYSEDKLITNMPQWFVNVWTDAGYCWGGSWQDIKDPMHFSWKGPAFTPGFGTLPVAYPPLTTPQAFTRQMVVDTVPGELDETRFRLLMDGDVDAAIDVVNVSDHPSGSVVDVIGARTGYRSCGVRRYLVPERIEGSTVIAGDWDRDGAQDLWAIDDASGVKITAFLRKGDFAESETLTVSTSPADVYLSADHNVDGWGDLYLLRRNGDQWTVEVRDGSDRFATVLATGSFVSDGSTSFTALDRNLDQVPDLVGVGSAGSFILDGAASFSQREALPGVALSADDIVGSDFDGDGRHDLVTLSGTKLRVYAGNSALPGVEVRSWFESPDYECHDNTIAYPYEGTFGDDDESVHAANIEVIAALGVTKGCNPPLNDRYCPDASVTRGQMAAFLRRALALPASTVDYFDDDGASEFEADVNAVAAAGITKGCNPPANDRYCPDRPVDRGQMAAFLRRAFRFPTGDRDYFVDDTDSIFEADINAIAKVGVTKGCNPPTNDRYCPGSDVTRAQMASFLSRAIASSSP